MSLYFQIVTQARHIYHLQDLHNEAQTIFRTWISVAVIFGDFCSW